MGSSAFKRRLRHLTARSRESSPGRRPVAPGVGAPGDGDLERNRSSLGFAPRGAPESLHRGRHSEFQRAYERYHGRPASHRVPVLTRIAADKRAGVRNSKGRQQRLLGTAPASIMMVRVSNTAARLQLNVGR